MLSVELFKNISNRIGGEDAAVQMSGLLAIKAYVEDNGSKVFEQDVVITES